MASVARSEDYLAVCARDKVIITSSRGFSCLKYELSTYDDQPEDIKQDVNESKKKTSMNEEHHVIDCKFSPFEKYFAICSSDKMLLVWDTSSWRLAYNRCIPRRPMKLLFCQTEDAILVADKTGNVYKFNLGSESPAEHLLGHLSIILDMTFSQNGRELVTCDRDGKIRISSYPNCYNIEKFLMFHTSFVTSIAVDHNGQYLLSIDGERKLSLWNVVSGYHLDSIKIETESDSVPRKVCIDKMHGIYILFSESKEVLRFEIKEEKLKELKEIVLDSIPVDLLCDEQNILILQQSADQPLVAYLINKEREYVKLDKYNRLSCLPEIQQFLPEPMKLEPWKCNSWADDDN